jgi:hypothetical protein
LVGGKLFIAKLMLESRFHAVVVWVYGGPLWSGGVLRLQDHPDLSPKEYFSRRLQGRLPMIGKTPTLLAR